MHTFIVDEDFEKSAKCLDNKRLGKQRVECVQILDTLLRNKDSWKNHPAVKMWIGMEWTLWCYLVIISREWVRRGYKNDATRQNIYRLRRQILRLDPGISYLLDEKLQYHLPKWLNKDFIISHRSNLLRKDPVWYGKFKWKVPNDLPYVWPVIKVVTPV
jgi:hypothetical protein